MELLEALRAAHAAQGQVTPDGQPKLRVALATNFTDDLFQKALVGLCAKENILLNFYAVPYQQYPFALKDPTSAFNTFAADLTIFFFDATPYGGSEWSDPDQATHLLEDLDAYRQRNSGILLLHTLIEPTWTTHEYLAQPHPLEETLRIYHQGIRALAGAFPNAHVVETDRVVRMLGEAHVRDLRGQYAFAQPFRHEFILEICRIWTSYARLLRGKTRKCLVLDFDNVLWGGILGEVGVDGIALGPDYPGSAYLAFQRMILEYHQRGIILAANSRNNLKDAQEVFERHPHMLLREEHFSSLQINWRSKAENILAIAEELNIGIDSMLFLDDEPLNRDLVRTQLPDVLVPDFSLPPEDYVKTVLELRPFHQLQMTDEDRTRGRLYAEERQRHAAREMATDLGTYLSSLNIEIVVHVNNKTLVPRLAQLTQKTNQFNLTTRRYTEGDIERFLQQGIVVAGQVHDRFGDYGVTLLAIIHPITSDEATLDTFLMSCRVMGRRVEQAFLHAIGDVLRKRGVQQLKATFIPSAKNAPAAHFLASMSGQTTPTAEKTNTYALSLGAFLHHQADISHVTIKFQTPLDTSPSLFS